MSQPLRQAIDRFPIAEWAGRHLQVYEGEGANLYADCPICLGKKKLSVHRTKRIARCFKCEAGFGQGVWNGRADCVRFVMLVLHCPIGQAVEEIVRHAGPLPRAAEERGQDTGREGGRYELPSEALLIGTACSASHPCRKYLARRGMERFMSTWYVCVTGRFAGRLVIPVENFGAYRGFEAKSYLGQQPKSLSHVEPGAVYFSQLWDTSRDFAVITESVFDAEAVGVNAVGLFGSSISQDRFATLLRLREERGVRRLIWFLDGDAQAKQVRLVERWGSGFFDNVFVRCDPDEDPASLSFARRWELIRSAQPIRSAFDLALACWG